MDTPEGRLIEDARERSGLSQNEAARRAGMSGTRWRQIVNREAPQMTSRRGVRTIARMAQVVGVTAVQFGGVGRGDVADLLPEGDESESTLTPEELRLIERLRTDPAARQRFFDAILAGHGHPRGTTESDPDEHQGQRRYG